MSGDERRTGPSHARMSGHHVPPHVPDDALGGGSVFADALARWAADARVDDAARQRTRRRWLRIQQEEETSLAGVLLDLAEQGRTAVIEVTDHAVRGRIVGLGADFLAMRSAQGQHVLVRTPAVEVVRAEPDSDPVAGDRAPVVDGGLAGLVGVLSGDRPDVAIRTRSGRVVRGRLRAASPSVLRVQPEGEIRAPTWIPLEQVALLVLEP